MAIKFEGDPLGRDQVPAKPEKPPRGAGKNRTAAPSPKAKALPGPAVVDAASGKGEKINTRGPGRPKGPHDVAVSLKLSSDMIERIDLKAHLRNIRTRSDAIRALLEEALK